jgi:hypothetical protein
MDFIKRNFKRITIDTAGYLLLVAAALTGWLPGPGGIPLALAGLSLLSINNAWARHIREYLLDHGGKFVQALFPPKPYIQWLYDILVVGLLAIVTLLAYQHAAVWQMALAVSLFILAVTIALLNRDRLNRLKSRRKHKQ